MISVILKLFFSDIGSYKGVNYNLNIPFHEGLKSEPFVRVCKSVIGEVFNNFHPNAIVCQCGADALAHDPVEGLNLTPDAYVQVS